MIIINKIFNLEKIFLFSKIKLKKNLIKNIIKIKKNYKLRIYILGGGCSGFKYIFTKEKNIKKYDILIIKNGNLIIDSISFSYLIKSKIDYNNNNIIINNKNIADKCDCGNSFKLKI